MQIHNADLNADTILEVSRQRSDVSEEQKQFQMILHSGSL